MSSLSTLPKGDSAWLLRKSIQRIMQQVSVLETNIGSSTTGNSANTQVIFNDAGTLRGDTGLTYDKSADRLSFGAGICYGLLTSASATITGDLTVDTSTLKVDSANNRVGIGTASPATRLEVADANGIPLRFGDIASAPASQTACYVGMSTATLAGATNGDLVLVPRTSGSNSITLWTGNGTASERYRIDGSGVATWSNVGGVAGTAMTLNATGLGVGVSPTGYGILALKKDNTSAPPYIVLDNRGTGGTDTNTYTQGGILFGAFRDVSNPAYIASITVERKSAAGGASSTGDLIFGTASTPTNGVATERLRIDASGNCGIGVTPSAWYTTGGYRALQIGNASLYGRNSTNSEAYLSANAFEDASANPAYITSSFASRYTQDNGVHKWFTAPSGTAGNAITFTQAMTLDASGNLLVGSTTSPNNSRIYVRNGNASSPSIEIGGITGDVGQAGLIVGKFDNDSTTSQILVRFTINNNTLGSGQINANGASQAAFGSFSDSRLKENIVSLPSQLANILSLRPVEFDYKDGSGHQIGFVAQEMQEVYSDAVGEQDGFLTVTGWSKTEARLVSAIKELAAKVQALEAKLA